MEKIDCFGWERKNVPEVSKTTLQLETKQKQRPLTFSLHRFFSSSYCSFQMNKLRNHMKKILPPINKHVHLLTTK